MLGTSIVLGIFATILVFMWEKEAPRPPLALSAERVVKIEAPQAVEFQKKQKREAEKAEAKSKEKEGQMKRAKDKAGKLGRDDAKQKDTVIPKGSEDILREKVQKIGILSVIGQEKAPGSGLSKLFAQNNDVEQAMAGMAGAKMQVGRGSGGLSTSGSGPGGGGTGFGHIYGAGNLDTGGRGTHGKGRGPKLAERGEHEVGVGMGNGAGDTDGSLSKEQINKVVRAHLAGIKYCYEKELQHKASLSGGIDIFWVIQPDGTVSKANVKNTTMGDAAVEGCIVRQVKQWQFPKAPGQTTVGRYPFIFKGDGCRVVMTNAIEGRALALASLLAPLATATLACQRPEHAALLPGPTTSRGDRATTIRCATSGADAAVPQPDRRRSRCSSTPSATRTGYDMDIPWIPRDKVHVEVSYKVTNLDDQDGRRSR